MSDIADRIDRLSDAFEAKIRAAPDDSWSNPSPCEDWTARDVVRHVVDVHGMMIRPLARTLSEAPSVDDDPVAAFRSARADVAAVLADPELATTEYEGVFGRAVVQETIDRFLGFDLVVHGWDLARATGQNETIDPAEVDRLARDAAALGDAIRSPGVCGPAVTVPDDAPAQDRLLALLGRDPA